MKKKFFRKKCFPPKCSFGHLECSFDRVVGKTPTKSWKKNPLNIREIWPNFCSNKFFLLSKCSSRHVECIFDNCVGKKLEKWARVFLSMSENDKKINLFQKAKFYFKSFAWSRIMQFWERHRRTLTKFLRKCHSNLKKIYKTIFQERTFSQSDQMDTSKAVLTTSANKKLIKAIHFHLKSENIMKTHGFQTKNCFSLFLRTQRMQFR